MFLKKKKTKEKKIIDNCSISTIKILTRYIFQTIRVTLKTYQINFAANFIYYKID